MFHLCYPLVGLYLLILLGVLRLKEKIQKHISSFIKPLAFGKSVASDMVRKASLQKLVLDSKDYEKVIKKVGRLPFVVSMAFNKVLANGLCTTARIKNHSTNFCFACGKFRDELYHYLRCPSVSFIFGLPNAFGNIHVG